MRNCNVAENDNDITPAMRQAFLEQAMRDAMAVCDRLDLPKYFAAFESGDPHAAAILAMRDQLQSALSVAQAWPSLDAELCCADPA